MDLTIKILEEIRDAVKDNSARIDQTNARLASFETRVEDRFASFENHVVGVELRLSTWMAEISSNMATRTQVFKQTLGLRDRVEACEQEIAAIKQKI